MTRRFSVPFCHGAKHGENPAMRKVNVGTEEPSPTRLQRRAETLDRLSMFVAPDVGIRRLAVRSHLRAIRRLTAAATSRRTDMSQAALNSDEPFLRCRWGILCFLRCRCGVR